MRAVWDIGGVVAGYAAAAWLFGKAVFSLWHDRDRPGRGWK